jgi:hypothetical protein
MKEQCGDPVVGDILAGWRYDISGLAPEMRGDYEAHFTACGRCRARQHLHRTIDISLIVLATISAGLFLLAFIVIRRYSPHHALLLEIIALGGFAFSAMVWVIVAIVTPVPTVVLDAAKTRARQLSDHLPPEIRDRLPDELKLK